MKRRPTAGSSPAGGAGSAARTNATTSGAGTGASHRRHADEAAEDRVRQRRLPCEVARVGGSRGGFRRAGGGDRVRPAGIPAVERRAVDLRVELDAPGAAAAERLGAVSV